MTAGPQQCAWRKRTTWKRSTSVGNCGQADVQVSRRALLMPTEPLLAPMPCLQLECSRKTTARNFYSKPAPRSQQGGLWGPKGYSPTQGMLTKGYFLAQLPQTNGKGCEGRVCSRMLDLKCHSQQHPQGLKGRAKKSPVLPSERQGEDSDRPKLPGCGLPLQLPTRAGLYTALPLQHVGTTFPLHASVSLQAKQG